MLENGILMKQDWEEVEGTEVGHCLGCSRTILDYEEYLELEEGYLHDEITCTYEFVRNFLTK